MFDSQSSPSTSMTSGIAIDGAIHCSKVFWDCVPNKVVRRATPYPVALSPLKLKIISLDHVTTDKTTERVRILLPLLLIWSNI